MARTNGTLCSASVISDLFNREFESTESTVLVGGGEEPFFAPGHPSRIVFRADYVRSALHEVSHWCVAGMRRRRLADYGYWYSPEGRSGERQSAFFAVEARTQAIEAIFCDALGIPFAPSIDNVSADLCDAELEVFSRRICQWQDQFCSVGLPSRAERFRKALLACEWDRANSDAAKIA